MLRDWTQSDKIDQVSAEAERFFTRLIMKADDYGCFWGDTRLLNANLFPLKLEKVKSAHIEKWVKECIDASLIIQYESNGKKYLQIIDFGQRLDKARAKFPLPIGQNESSKSYVYIMYSEAALLYKIGFSKNPWARVKEVSKDFSDVQIMMLFEGTIEDETRFHEFFKKLRIKGEWYKLGNDVIRKFSMCYEKKVSASECLSVFRRKIVVDYVPAEVEVEVEVEENKNKKGGENGANAPAPTDDLEIRKRTFAESLVPYVPTYGKKLIREFYEYWTEPNKSKTKFRQEMERTWDTERRLKTWASKDKNFNSTIQAVNGQSKPETKSIAEQEGEEILTKLRAKVTTAG